MSYSKSTHNRRERPVCGHRGRSRGPFYYRITTFGKGPWDARDPHKTTFMALKHVIRLSIWQRQKETPGVEKAPGVSSPQRKESGRSGRDDGELRFGYDPAIHARRLRVYHLSLIHIYPVYFDMEDKSTLPYSANFGAIASAFCSKISAAGYPVGVYAVSYTHLVKACKLLSSV